jgi:drug/metabolite transporter (DMT)-like permease
VKGPASQLRGLVFARGIVMKSTWPLLIGGYFPAFLWGITAIFQKQSAQAATGPALYLMTFGVASAIVGIVWALISQPFPWTGRGIVFAAAAGLCFGTATALINYALFTYAIPVSKLAPIWSCNVLVTLSIGAMVLGEASEVNLVRLVTGAFLIAGGAVLVSAS